MVESTEEFVRRLNTAAHEARSRHRELRRSEGFRPRKPQKQIPISLFHDMFGRKQEQYWNILGRLKTR